MLRLQSFNNNSLRENIWTAYSGKTLHSHKEMVPKHVIMQPELEAIVDVIFETEKYIAEKMKKGQLFYVKHFEYGYNKVNPVSNVEYIFNLKVCCLGNTQGILDDKRSYWIRRNFSEFETFEEELDKVRDHTKKPELSHAVAKDSNATVKTRVNFVVPLAGKVPQFMEFMNIFENSFLQHKENVSLLVVLFWEEKNKKETRNLISIIAEIRNRFPEFRIQLVTEKGEFNRGVALNIGASFFKENELLFFVDVDCFVDKNIIDRIRGNTIEGKQAYFPVMFSLYDPHFVRQEPNFTYSDGSGYWRFHSYGQVSIYKSDFSRAGGYDTSIRGWGKEDIEFFQRVLDKRLTTFRAPDPGLVHIFHKIHCGLELPHEQYRMCLGTKWATVGSEKTLSQIVYNTKEIIERNTEGNNIRN